MRIPWLIASKDLVQRLRDRSAIMLAIVAPLGLAFIFGLVLPTDTTGFDIQVALVDQDRGAVSQAFGQIVEDLDDLFAVEVVDDLDDTRARVEADELQAAYVFPPGFSSDVTTGGTGTMHVLGSPDSQISAQIAHAVAAAYATDTTAVQVAAATAQQVGVDAGATIDAAVAAPAPISLVDETAADRTLSLATYFSAGMAVFFLFFTVQFGISGLIEERTLGTLPRLLAAPISPWGIVVGKGLSSFILGVISMSALAVGTTWLVGASWGSWPGVLLLIIAGVLSALGIMAVVATFARTPEQASNWQTIVAIVLGMLGGSFFPVAQGAVFLALLSRLTPHFWFLEGLGELSGGGGPADVMPEFLALVLLAGAALGLAATRVERMVQP